MINQLKYYFLIFTISGFSGLIYQSIWSRYLKMFLGHASYAQMVVLIIFMGGMAIGSALAAKYSFKLKKLLVLYALCELIVGFMGITFHGFFTGTMEFTFTSIISNLDSSLSITSVKFLIAGLIILPQSILLGATFPLITSGLLRKYPDNTGTTIAKLYFFNSIGAAIGVISNAFILVPKFGLPGAVMTAGIINILLAIVVYIMDKGQPETTPTKISPSHASEKLVISNRVKLLLVIAFITGMASFMYEIAWIRMLSMVLGASTDAFEIMLSAFILGLAIGSWMIRKRINQIRNSVATLAVLQLLMGVLALLTIPMYSYAFSLMSATQNVLSSNADAYLVYNIACYLICVFIMLPTTICAGTTLPLITNILITDNKTESSIGYVYSLNTLGAIVGVLISIQILMPYLGLKSLVVIGGGFDIILGLVLLFSVKFSNQLTKPLLVATPVMALFAILFLSNLSPDQMTSGVFRYGNNKSLPGKLIFLEHGKTSTVAIKEFGGNQRMVSNNGKPDASLFFKDYPKETKYISGDEPTMILLGALPFLYNQNIKNVANIGFGSGLTSEMLLSNPNIDRLDTIEIEQKVIDASVHFAPRITKVHTDPRSKIIIDDAKTFFVSNGLKYDSIIAEPPNPWVSGVSSLFSHEFYSLVKKYLSPEGVYSQWLHTYEINPGLVASVYKAMRKEFKYITLYQVSVSDMVFIARNNNKQPDYSYYNNIEETEELLTYIGVNDENDFEIRKIADQRILDYYFNQFPIPYNSDYFPILDNSSAAARFMKQNANAILDLNEAKILKQTIGEKYLFNDESKSFSLNNYSFEQSVALNRNANYTVDFITGKLINSEVFSYDARSTATDIENFLNACSNGTKLIKPNEASSMLLSWLTHNFNYMSNKAILSFIDTINSQCKSNINKTDSMQFNAIYHFANNDYSSSFLELDKLFAGLKENQRPSDLIAKLYLACIAKGYGKKEDVLNKLKRIDSFDPQNPEKSTLVQLVKQRFIHE